MNIFKLVLLLVALFFAFLFISNPVHCNDKEDSVLEGINSFRQIKNLSSLNQVPKATCFANQVAEEIEGMPCETFNQSSLEPSPGGNPKMLNLQKHIDKCDIKNVNLSSSSDGLEALILPVCVSKLEPTVVLSYYTNSDYYAQFLNNSKYTGVGLGTEDDWMVLLLLTTDTTTRCFSAAIPRFTNSIEFLLLPFLLVLINYLQY
ncbi:hypothetical protein RJT34_19084 [Clitoria ternatea]|uniref:Uncharacterized GPI-anchored protein At5g19230-like domain-containing protein n=1 Tax=Clitoria ternatea TaxID=43366 RepID=A0AAN9IQK1_CLITE